MENSFENNMTNLPFVPCKEGQIVSNGMVLDYDGTPIGRFDSSLEATNEIEPVPWADFSKIQFPENRWIIKNLVPAGGFMVLAAPSGEKKTWLALEMSKAIACGDTYLGQFPTEKGSVLYLNGEMPQSEVQRRGKLLGLAQLENIWLLNRELDFYRDESNIEWFFEFVREKNIKAIFIDTFRAFAGGMREEKAEEIREFFNRLKPLKDEGIALVILDHCRKPSRFEGQTPKKEQLFASQDKVASVEVLLMLKSNAGTDDIFVYQLKNRLGKEIEPFLVSMTDVTNEQGEVKEVNIVHKGQFILPELKREQAQDLIIAALQDGGKNTTQLVEIIMQEKIGEKNAKEAMRALVAKGQIVIPHKQGKQNFYTLPAEDKEVAVDITEASNLFDSL